MKNIKIINTVLNCSGKVLKNSQSLDKYTWDSMAMISLISILEKKTKKKINVQNLRKLKNIQDLDKFISIYIK